MAVGDVRIGAAIAMPFDDLSFPANGIDPPGLASDPARNTGDGLLDFSTTIDNVIAASRQVPHSWARGSSLWPHVHVKARTNPAGVGNVVLKFEYKWFNGPSGEPAAYTSEQKTFTLSDFVGGLPLVDIFSFSEIAWTSQLESAHFMWKFTRVATDGADTFNALMGLHELDLHFQRGKFGTKARVPT